MTYNYWCERKLFIESATFNSWMLDKFGYPLFLGENKKK